MKIRTVALGLMLASGMALAQDAPHGSPNASDKQPFVARMKNDLDLTDEQVKKMREIRDNGGSREEMQAVLTPEQRAKAAEKKTEYRSDRTRRRARVQEELGLSDEQMDKMNAIKRNGGTREDMREVLTPEQQAKWDGMHGKRAPRRLAPAGAAGATTAAPAAPKPAAAPTSSTTKPTTTLTTAPAKSAE